MRKIWYLLTAVAALSATAAPAAEFVSADNGWTVYKSGGDCWASADYQDGTTLIFALSPKTPGAVTVSLTNSSWASLVVNQPYMLDVKVDRTNVQMHASGTTWGGKKGIAILISGDLNTVGGHHFDVSYGGTKLFSWQISNHDGEIMHALWQCSQSSGDPFAR